MLLFVMLAIACSGGDVTLLPRAHAHNDYEHPRPLLDALEHGFCSVEADIFLRDGELLVGHHPRDLKSEKTLKSLYLEPLKRRVQTRNGSVYDVPQRFFLFIDIKTDAGDTYPILHQMLKKYADILTEVKDGVAIQRAVTVVLSGNRPSLEVLALQSPRFVAYDGRLSDLESKVPNHLMPIISDNWATKIGWGGSAEMNSTTRDKLQQIVSKSHEHGRLVRFWATPEKENVWMELLKLRVDLINTDRLSALQQFLLKHK